MHKSVRVAVAGLLATAMAATPAIAYASHFRSSFTDVTLTGHLMDWTIDSAWRVGSESALGGGYLYSVESPGGDPGAGTQIARTIAGAPLYDTSNPLYSRTTQTSSIDLATANSGSPIADGQYDLFASGCCRVDGVMNTSSNDSFSQWVRFSKSGSSYNLPPAFNAPTLYLIIELSGETAVDFTATDPEAAAVSYSEIRNTNFPYYGSTGLSCSSFSGGILTLSAALCTGSDVFTDIYTPGSFWTYKVQASDPDGNFSTVDTLFRVITPPEPYIDADRPVRAGNTYEFTTYADDTITDSFTVTCTNAADPTDIRSGTSATTPVTVEGFRPGASYDCDVSAINSAGTGTNDQNYSVGPIAMNGLDLALDLDAGMPLEGALAVLSGGNLLPRSAYTLERHSTDPVGIYAGTTDSDGNFYELVTIPSDACASGIHQLILTGINLAGDPVSDTVWVEMDASCTAVQVSRTEITPSLPSLPNSGLSTLSIVLGTMLAGVFFVFASGAFTAKSELQFAGNRVRLVSLLKAADARLRRTERTRRR